MKYKELINRKIFIGCTDVASMKQVINFLRYKRFDWGGGEFYYKNIFVGMSLYLTNGGRYQLMHASNTGILMNNDFDQITDMEFLKHNKLSWIERLDKKPFGYIE